MDYLNAIIGELAIPGIIGTYGEYNVLEMIELFFYV
jgi:hypothetical protein